MKIGGEADLPQNEDDLLDEAMPDQKAKASAKKRKRVAIAY
jgi:hypothetical protein